ncbi:MAG: DUF427 domain-containing protein [Nevskia sp.]|nr:DUF427 domain-containing protein [Nevskia sp.]
MTQSPGHRKFPDHRIVETRVPHRMQAIVNGEVVADSADVIRLEEDRHPVRFYFPRADVRMDRLERTQTATECPFKGTARYFSLKTAGHTLPDAVWTYEEPYDEMQGIKDRLAFYEDQFTQIQVVAKA